MSFAKYRLENSKGVHVQQIAWETFVDLSRNYIKAALDVNSLTGRMAINNLGRAMSAPAWAKIGDKDKLKTTEVASLDRLVDQALSDALNTYEKNTPAILAINLSDYAGGKACNACDDAGNTWLCAITIPAATVTQVESYGAGMAMSSIKGILANDPVLISPISTSLGKRCIKPEPYGWIFSTSSSVRLVDTATTRANPRPAALTFDTVRNVK